jgi:glutathione synthase
MSIKIALMDRYGTSFTEGENFKQYALGFLENGCEVFQLDPYTLDFERSSGEVYLLQGEGNLQRQEDPSLANLNLFDVIMDLSDMVNLDFAERLSKIDVLHINPPLATYESADKRTYVRNYPEFIPPTIVSSSIGGLEKALRIFGGVMIVKDPLGSCGTGIERVDISDSNYRDILISLTKGGKEPVVAQKFLHFAYEGSKRVAVIGDIKDTKSYRVIHFYGRKHPGGDWKDNISQGGRVVKLGFLRKDEKDLCLNVAERSGLYAVGLDIMDDLDENGNRIPRLLETNAALAFGSDKKHSEKLKMVPNFVLGLLKN